MVSMECCCSGTVLFLTIVQYLLSIMQPPTYWEITAPNLYDDTQYFVMPTLLSHQNKPTTCMMSYFQKSRQSWPVMLNLIPKFKQASYSMTNLVAPLLTAHHVYLNHLKKLHSNNSTTKVNKTAVLCHGSLSD